MRNFTAKFSGMLAGVFVLCGATLAPSGFSPACASGYCPPYCQCVFDSSGNPVFCSHEDCFDCRG